MWNGNGQEQNEGFHYGQNPYDSFMRKHLQHYGYYTGRNQGYRNTFTSYADWEKNYSFALSSGSSESCQSDSDSDDESKKVSEYLRSCEGKENTLHTLKTSSFQPQTLRKLCLCIVEKLIKHNKLQEELLKTTQLVYINQDGKGMVPRLREPRSLYAVAKELGPQQAARWPSDIQVIPQRIKHIEYTPQEPEPFYRKTGLEKSPMVRGEERGGRLVYQYEPRSTFFVRSRVGGIRTGPEKCAISIDRAADDTTLIFESRFESGNLAKAIQVGDYDYELWLRYDLYTSKHTQWFYFSIQNTRPNVTYRFSIVNFMKPDSLYNYGMKPLMYSEKDARQKKIGWRRCGISIKYYRNNLTYDTSKGDRPFYSMTWTTTVPHKGDTVYFSHCFPYTYTDLQDYLLDLSNDPVKSKICKQRVLCRTLAGNLVYVLTITSPSQNPEDIKHKKAVVLTARVHPGESNASWMMKGFLDYLCSNSADAKLLRDTFIFKIVPMLNPDGVIVGNYRCSLAGRDLNRNYKTVLKDSYPSVWHTKQMIRRLLQERDIVAYCDLHGHSRRQNVFIYGCENRHNPQRRLRERIFPCMLSKNSPGKFSFDSCKFKIQKSKEGTGRVVMWNMGILNSYTMEATFCGSSLGKKKGFHFSAADFEAMGYDFCDTLLDYCDPDTSKCANVLCDLEENLKKEIIKKLEQKGIDTADVDLSDNLSDYEMESSDGGSDSSVSDGPPVHLQFAPSRVSKKKKKLRTKKERDRVRGLDGNKRDRDRPTQEESGTNSNRKPLSGHQTAHAKQDKLMQLLRGETTEKTYLSLKNTQQMRYTNASPKRPKSNDERERVDVVHGSARERSEEQLQKRPRKLLETAKCDVEDTQALAVSNADNGNSTPSKTGTDYLEQLTHAYLRNGILQNQAEQVSENRSESVLDSLRVKNAAPHFRYSGSGKVPSMPFNLEGLCPHHEQAFAAQLMAQQLQNMSGDPSVKTPHKADKRRELKPTIMDPGGLHHPKKFRPVQVVGNSFVRVWKDYIQKHKQPPKLQRVFPSGDSLHSLHTRNFVWKELNMEDFMRTSMDNTLSPIDKRPLQRHILEVSAAQQRQQELLHQRRGSGKSAGSHRSHQHSQDEKGMSSRLRAQVPSATYINYDTFKISQMNLEDNGDDDSKESAQGQHEGSQETGEDNNSRKDSHHNHRHHHTHSGRKSRMAMHDSEDDEQSQQQDRPDYVRDPHTHQAPRVSSAQTGGEEMNSAIQSIKDLRQSLVSTASNSNLSPTAGNYIKRLLSQEIRQADEEIDELTAKLQHNIDEKQKHYDVMVEQQEQQTSGRESVRSTSNIQSELKLSDKMIAKSAPSVVNKTKEIIDKPDRLNRTPSASGKTKRELIPKPIRTHTNSTSSIGTSPRIPKETPTRVPVDSGKVTVDAYYSLPNSKLKVDTGQRARKLQEVEGPSVNINASLKDTVSKVNRGINTVPRRGESIPNAVMTDLTQVQNQYNSESAGARSGQTKYSSNSRHGNISQTSSAPHFNKGSTHAMNKERSGGSQNNNSAMLDRGRSASSSSSHDDNSLAEPRSWSVTNEEGSEKEPVLRVRSARNSNRQVVETVPTKISLMITQEREESRFSGGQFLPMSRSVRGPNYKSAQVIPRRK